ncbi:MAG: DNA-3-methyladenine glycosylase family protein [Solirubrobacteraceae bacterium]
MSVTVRVEARPRWPLRLQRFSGMDGVLLCRRAVLHRLLCVEGERVLLRAAQPTPDQVVLDARAATRRAAEYALERWRFALGIDDDLRPFHERFRGDPLIGRSVRAAPHLRPARRPEPFEALAWAVCEQLIEVERAGAIQRRIVARWGRRCPETGLRDVPAPAALAAAAPAELEACGLTAGRAMALVRAAREVASGRADLHAPDHERSWRRLGRIPGIGSWTVEMLALRGQGRFDQVPAGDLGLRKLVGRLQTGRPRARVEEDEVREFFAPYAPWAGLVARHALAAISPEALPAI